MHTIPMILVFLSCIPPYSSCIDAAPTLPSITTTDVASDIHASPDASNQLLTDCFNRTLRSGEFSLFSNDTLYVESLNLTLNDSYFFVDDSVIICIPKDEDINTPVTYDIGTNMFIPIIILGLELMFIYIKVNLKHLLFCNLLLLCVALLGLCASFVLTDWYDVQYFHYLRTISMFANFFLVVSSSWLSILSSGAFTLNKQVLQIIKKIEGVIQITNFDVILRRVHLAVMAFLASIAPFHVAVESHFFEFEGFSWETGKNPSPFVFTGSVISLLILNLGSYIIGTKLNRKRENYAYFVNSKCLLALKKNYIFFFILSAISYGSWFTSVSIYWLAIPELLELIVAVFIMDVQFILYAYYAVAHLN